MFVRPANRFGYITGHLFDRCVRNKSIVGGDENETSISKYLRLLLHARFVSLGPTTAMKPGNDGKVFSSFWRVNVQPLHLLIGITVRYVTSHMQLCHGERGGEQHDY